MQKKHWNGLINHLFKSCYFLRQSGNGLYLNGCEPIRIYANVVHANADTGISVEQIATEEAAMVTIQDNSITCNAGCGIQVAPYGQVSDFCFIFLIH